MVLTSCSDHKHYVAVEDAELGRWQDEIEEICNRLEYVQSQDDIDEIYDQAYSLKCRMNRNFIDSEDAEPYIGRGR